jgi:putative FmdB family regulatory protein
MPTYEYECPEGHTFEKFQKISDKPRAKCPVCGKPGTRKISGGAGLVFRGSGFYITDYGKDGKGPRKPEAEKPAKATEGTGAAGGAESKPKPEPSSSKQGTGKGGGKASNE